MLRRGLHHTSSQLPIIKSDAPLLMSFIVIFCLSFLFYFSFVVSWKFLDCYLLWSTVEWTNCFDHRCCGFYSCGYLDNYPNSIYFLFLMKYDKHVLGTQAGTQVGSKINKHMYTYLRRVQFQIFFFFETKSMRKKKYQ